MSSTTFTDGQSIIYSSWLNDVNSTVYNGTFQAASISPANLVCNGSVSGTGFTGLVNNTLTAPGAIGNGTPNTGAFTTLTASTPIALTSGGTGSSTASGARTNLGLGTLATLSTVGTAQITDANITPAKLSGAQTGSAPIYGVRAWANFNGTGTPSINASGNIASITFASNQYTVTFTTAMPDAYYAISGSYVNNPADVYVRGISIISQTASSFVFQIAGGNAEQLVTFMVIR